MKSKIWRVILLLLSLTFLVSTVCYSQPLETEKYIEVLHASFVCTFRAGTFVLTQFPLESQDKKMTGENAVERVEVARKLGEKGKDAILSVPYLIELLEDHTRIVEEKREGGYYSQYFTSPSLEAEEALTKITGEKYGKDRAKWQDWWNRNKEKFTGITATATEVSKKTDEDKSRCTSNLSDDGLNISLFDGEKSLGAIKFNFNQITRLCGPGGLAPMIGESYYIDEKGNKNTLWHVGSNGIGIKITDPIWETLCNVAKEKGKVETEQIKK
jgi:hypothetical protein